MDNRRGATESKSADFHSVTSQWRKRAATEGKQEVSQTITLNKKGATEWTVGKLLALILAVVLIVLVIYGISSGAIIPLKDRIVGMYDNVLGLFGVGDSGGGGGEADCLSPIKISDENFTKNVGEGSLIFCKKSCVAVLDDNLKYRLNYENGKFEKYGEVFEAKGSGLSLTTATSVFFRYNDILDKWEGRYYQEWIQVPYEDKRISQNSKIQKQIIEFLPNKDFNSGKSFLLSKDDGKEGITFVKSSTEWVDIEHEIITNVEEMEIQQEVYINLIKQVEEQSENDKMVEIVFYDRIGTDYAFSKVQEKMRTVEVEIKGEKYFLDLEAVGLGKTRINVLFIKNKEIPYGIALSSYQNDIALVPLFDIYEYYNIEKKWIKVDDSTQSVIKGGGVSAINFDAAIKLTKIKEFLEKNCR